MTNKIFFETIINQNNNKIIFIKEYSIFIKKTYILFLFLIISCYLSDYLFFCRNGDYNLFHYFEGRNFSLNNYKNIIFNVFFLIGIPIITLFFSLYLIFSKIFKIIITPQNIILQKQFNLCRIIDKSIINEYSIEFLLNKIVFKHKNTNKKQEFIFFSKEINIKIQNVLKEFEFL